MSQLRVLMRRVSTTAGARASVSMGTTLGPLRAALTKPVGLQPKRPEVVEAPARAVNGASDMSAALRALRSASSVKPTTQTAVVFARAAGRAGNGSELQILSAMEAGRIPASDAALAALFTSSAQRGDDATLQTLFEAIPRLGAAAGRRTLRAGVAAANRLKDSKMSVRRAVRHYASCAAKVPFDGNAALELLSVIDRSSAANSLTAADISTVRQVATQAAGLSGDAAWRQMLREAGVRTQAKLAAVQAAASAASAKAAPAKEAGSATTPDAAKP